MLGEHTIFLLVFLMMLTESADAWPMDAENQALFLPKINHHRGR